MCVFFNYIIYKMLPSRSKYTRILTASDELTLTRHFPSLKGDQCYPLGMVLGVLAGQGEQQS